MTSHQEGEEPPIFDQLQECCCAFLGNEPSKDSSRTPLLQDSTPTAPAAPTGARMKSPGSSIGNSGFGKRSAAVVPSSSSTSIESGDYSNIPPTPASSLAVATTPPISSAMGSVDASAGNGVKAGKLAAPISRLDRAPSADIVESDDDSDDDLPSITQGLASLKPPSAGGSPIPRGSDPTPTTPASSFNEASPLGSGSGALPRGGPTMSPEGIPILLDKSSPKWRPDSAANNCQRCGKGFTRTTRRHHCRFCGDLYCADCTVKRTHPTLPASKLVRACKKTCAGDWQADSTAIACGICRKKFGGTRRKHHCRDCGKVYCGTCTGMVPDPESASSAKTKRVCNNCSKKSAEEGGAGWVPDSDVKACMRCHKGFTPIRRKHHCRRCGKVMCDDCSPKTVDPTKKGKDKVRMCKECFADAVEEAAS